MKHRFRVEQVQDVPVAVSIAAYLDCEHYLHLHKGITGDLEILRVEGRKVTVRQTWKWFGLTMGHTKSGEYFPPARFVITDVKPSPWWVPSIHHVLGMTTDLRYEPVAAPQGECSHMIFDVELEMPFWLWPLRGFLQGLVERMHAQQVQEDLDALKRRAKLFGRGNIAAYLAPGQFLYHKDDFVKHFSPQRGHVREPVALEREEHVPS